MSRLAGSASVWGRVANAFCWLVALGLTSIAIWSAWDDGGGYLITQAVVAFALLGLVPVGLLSWWGRRNEQAATDDFSGAGSFSKSGQRSRRGLRIPLPVTLAMLVWLFALFQCCSLPWWALDLMSAGSAEAWRGIPETLVMEAGAAKLDVAGNLAQRSGASISVAPTFTRNALSVPAFFGIACWLGAMCVSRPRCVRLVILGTALAGGVFSFFGLADSLRLARDSEVELRQRLIISPVGAHDPFGPFVNNNTGAGYLNLSLGCALGGLAMIAGRTGWSSAGRKRRHLIQWINDWRAVAVVLLVTLLAAGVLGSQSRGGALGMLAGFGVLGLTKLKRGAIVNQILLGTVVVAVAWFLLSGLGIQDRTEQRLQTLTDGNALNDPRLRHWQDGLRAAWHYLWMGSGLGSYRFAYLPYQQSSGHPWFVNADGMHVEWLVEGGVWLWALLVTGLVSFIRVLRRQMLPNAFVSPSRATDVAALTTTMTFILPATLVTQSFDFGILQPPLLLTVAVLCGALVGIDGEVGGRISEARSEAGDDDALEMGTGNDAAESVRGGFRRIRLREGREFWRIPLRGASWLVGAAALVVLSVGLYWAALDLRDSAVVQRASLMHDRYLKYNASDLPDFEVAIEDVQTVLRRSPRHSEAHLVLAQLMIAQQRRLGAIYLIETEQVAAKDATRWVSPRNVRRAYHRFGQPTGVAIESLILPTQDVNVWLQAREHAMAALMLCPLDDRARIMLLELDMVHPQASASSQVLLEQAATLRCRNAETLRQLERLAAVYPGGDTIQWIQDVRRRLESEK
ncbi:O-antigen ligase family protein [Stieleria varia]|uniref:O-Antigen ligase n=1 Tax=Stieleria varia TaxID=2528005 RepID=A0A5C6AUF4_9BACT|nr:O-antigen ligase family protein [Stieleria varia]TWU02642.1 O-Antigen ligase [Stieleria varia]